MSAAGVKSKRLQQVVGYGILLVILVALASCSTPGAIAAQDPSLPETGPITVKIMNPEIREAIARVLETFETDSLDQGKLSFSACLPGQRISVSSPGYYTGSITCTEYSSYEYSILLTAMNAADNSAYSWMDAEVRSGAVFPCASCHANPALGLDEFTEWKSGGHSSTLINDYFRTTYTGANLLGQPGKTTTWGLSPEGRRVRLPAMLSEGADYGPGFQLDYPGESGNCAFCHAPAVVAAGAQAVNLSHAINTSWGTHIDVASEGVTCDVCHKVTGVLLDEHGLPLAEKPGILSFTLLRPDASAQFLAGPGAHLGTSVFGLNRACAPIFSRSEFCAPCHYAKFSGVEIYASYKEWLDSPYSQPNQSYRSCQDCHMRSPATVENTSREERSACSEANQDFRDFSHNMMNYGTDPANPSRQIPLLVQEAAEISIEQLSFPAGQVSFTVNVVNERAGHKFPTDSPLRHLILLVEVKDANGTSLTQVSGPILPRTGDPEFAGLAGEIYAHLLRDMDTSIVPSIAYWNPLELAWPGSDTRLVPREPRYSTYSFTAPSSGSIDIIARLIYRNAFSEIAGKKQIVPIDIEAASVNFKSVIPP